MPDQCSTGNKIANWLEGAGYGLSSFVGLSSLWNPTDDSEYRQALKNFQDSKTAWEGIISSDQATISTSIQEFTQDQMSLMTATSNLYDEIMSDNISNNSLLITILFGIVILIILFLLI